MSKGTICVDTNDSFRVSVATMTPERVKDAADLLERCIGEIANGQRKPGKLPLEELCVLIEHARRTLA